MSSQGFMRMSLEMLPAISEKQIQRSFPFDFAQGQDDGSLKGVVLGVNDYAYVYILANGYKKLYIGVTTKLALRVQQHKERGDPKCHTARYNINQLVYFETFTTVTAAIAREKQLKGWLRIRKLDLVISTNPDWLDLSKD